MFHRISSGLICVSLLVSAYSVEPANAQGRSVRRTQSAAPRHTTGSISGDRTKRTQSGTARSAGAQPSRERTARSSGDRGRASGDVGREQATRSDGSRARVTHSDARSDVVVRDTRARTTAVRRQPRYYRPVPWGTTITTLPHSHRTVVVHNTTYYCHDDIFYTVGPRPGHYVVARPPIGVQVTYIPSDAIVVNIGGFSFHYYDDVYYDDSLTVVDTPIGGYIYTLPPQHEVVVVRDVQYYRVGPAYYQPVIREGRTAFIHVDLQF